MKVKSYTFILLTIVELLLYQLVSSRQQVCNFDINTESNHSRLLLMKKTSDIPSLPKMVWSKLQHIPVVSPKFSTFVVTELTDVRINLMSGAVFDKSGCMSVHTARSPERFARERMMEALRERPFNIKMINPSLILDQEILYLGGSVHSKDWQHAVIDFLPLFGIALPYILRRPEAPIVAGKYHRFFDQTFPFNLSRFITKDYQYNRLSGSPIAPLFFARKVIYVDIIERDQSYLQPHVYDIILPFIRHQPLSMSCWSTWRNHVMAERREDSSVSTPLSEGHSSVSTPLSEGLCSPGHSDTSSPNQLTKANLVVYLDRSQLMRDAAYLRSAGLVNGRQVAEQDALIRRIKASLRQEYELVVWGCKDFRADRELLSRAAVLIGPHGGHFTNMLFAPPGAHVVELSRSYTMKQLRNSTGSGYLNARWVFAGLSAALGHQHWFVEDVNVVKEYLTLKKKPQWSDANITVNPRQLLDTLRAIGVST